VRTKPIICRVICEHPLFDESHALPSDDCFMTGGCDKLIEQSSPPNPELQTQTPFNKNIEYSSFKTLLGKVTVSAGNELYIKYSK
jgi:hypothetical protein